MKNIFLTSAIIAVMSCPAIALDANNHIQPSPTNDCVETTLGTATGPANLEADWTANTINLEWYNEDTKLTVPTTSNTCRYDGQITLPSTNPTKTGYTFRGWQVRAAIAQQCSLSGLDTSIGTTRDAQHMRWKPFNDNSMDAMQNVFGTENSSDLNNGEWAITFSYGTVKGTAKCSAKSGDNNNFNFNNASSEWTASESELTSASGEAQYCWCQIKGYDAENDGTYCPVASPSWVFDDDWGFASDCADYCAGSCADFVGFSSVCRAALFSQVQ